MSLRIHTHGPCDACVTEAREILTLCKEVERYKRAVIDLASRPWGVRRPKWLLATIERAKQQGSEG